MKYWTKGVLFAGAVWVGTALYAQRCYWQQEVRYEMDIEMNVHTHQYDGHQRLWYINHSPDTLHQVFYHLYFNAFRKGSMMDMRNRYIADPHPKIGDKIRYITPGEEGWIRVERLRYRGKEVPFYEKGTILQVPLPEPILPGDTVLLEMKYRAQVPIQIRRSGRDNSEGIAYTMTQWYPKLCEYDEHGWHPTPYVGREFYGVWGDYYVRITIDTAFKIAATGILKNADASGVQPVRNPDHSRWTWIYEAHNVHDFAWSADPDYLIKRFVRDDGIIVQYAYQPGEATKHWEVLPEIMDFVFDYANAKYGRYPYPIYTFAQGGDGGMEYPMITMITGHRSLESLVGVSVHELMHSWYQGVLGFNESKYAWMDEGFTSYATTDIMHQVFPREPSSEPDIPEGAKELMELYLPPADNPFVKVLGRYIEYANSPYEEALCRHADHFRTNYAYGMGSYVKGQVFLYQLGGIIGEAQRDRGLRKFFYEWQFKHPTDEDFIRTMEKVSGIQLDWYLEYWIHRTSKIDYAIDSLWQEQDGPAATAVQLVRVEEMPFPIDVELRLIDGRRYLYHIPLRIMFGHRPLEKGQYDGVQLLDDWPWTNPYYVMKLPFREEEIQAIIIDPQYKMADIRRNNNVLIVNSDN